MNDVYTRLNEFKQYYCFLASLCQKNWNEVLLFQNVNVQRTTKDALQTVPAHF